MLTRSSRFVVYFIINYDFYKKWFRKEIHHVSRKVLIDSETSKKEMDFSIFHLMELKHFPFLGDQI